MYSPCNLVQIRDLCDISDDNRISLFYVFWFIGAVNVKYFDLWSMQSMSCIMKCNVVSCNAVQLHR